jgi:polyisoprenoid-binding protein YceI
MGVLKMNRHASLLSWLHCLLLFSSGVCLAQTETHRIDPASSRITVMVFKSGFFSAFAHDHTIEARGLQGEVQKAPNPQIELRVETSKLQVLDPQLSAEKRAEVQQTMQGPKVLDIARFPEILFKSTSIKQLSPNSWNVTGQLTLHGQTQSITLTVDEQGGSYRGKTALRQRNFGMEPISLFGGTVKVKDEVRIEFNLALIN